MHHRRHDLAAHRGRGLDAPGKGRPIAEAFHQRDGELAGRHHIGHARARDRPHQPRGQHRHLGGAAGPVPDQPQRHIGEQLDHPGLLKELMLPDFKFIKILIKIIISRIQLMIGIYKITNLVNNKCYIGQSINIHNRWKQHKSALTSNRHHSIKLQNSWNKHGYLNFKFEVIEECEVSKLNDREL